MGVGLVSFFSLKCQRIAQVVQSRRKFWNTSYEVSGVLKNSPEWNTFYIEILFKKIYEDEHNKHDFIPVEGSFCVLTVKRSQLQKLFF